GERRTIEISASLPLHSVGAITNSVAAFADESESNLTDNVAEAVTRLDVPELRFTKSVDRSILSGGESNLVYTLSITNAGLAAANNLMVTDALPADVTFTTSAPPASPTNGLLTYNLGTLAAGAATSVTIQVTVGSTLEQFLNTAGVTTSDPERNTDDNQDSATSLSVDFTHRMKINFCGYDRSSTQTNIPLLIELHTGLSGFNYTDFSTTNGYDLRFMNETQDAYLNYEIERWTPSGTSLVWVQVAELVSSNTCIYAHWGGPNTNRQSYTTNGATWSEGYEAVWHMTDTNLLDATANGRHGASNGAPILTTGIVQSALQFDGVNDYVTIPGYPGVVGQNARSMSLWLNNNADGNDAIMSWGQNVAGDKWVYRFEPDGNLRVEVNGGNDTTANDYSDGVWRHVAFTLANDGSPNISEGNHYVNGTFVPTATAAGENIGTASNADVHIGQDPFSGGRLFNGLMDEVRISGVARSADWLWTVWYNMASNDPFACFNPVEFTEYVDLEIIKTVDQSLLEAGTNLNYTLTVSNLSLTVANGVVVTDIFPAELTFVSATPAEVTQNNGVIEFDLGTIAAGGSATIQVAAAVNPGFSGAVTNFAAVGTDDTDTNLVNNVTNLASVVDLNDLAIVKTVNQTNLSASTNLVYTITITNRGPFDLTTIQVTDMLPAGVVYLSALPAPSTVTSNSLVFDIARLDAGTTTGVTVNVGVSDSVTGLALTNQASVVTSDQTELDLTNNVAEAVTTLNLPDLRLSKSVDNTTLLDSNLLYTIEIANEGIAVASNIVVSDLLPTGITFVSSAPAEDGRAGNLLTYLLGDLGPGRETSIVIQATTTTNLESSITNTASVTAANVELNLSNNTDTAVSTLLDYACRVRVALCGYDRASTLTNIPMLVELTPGISGFDYADFARADGYDLRFTDCERISELAYEIETWNTNGSSYIWVRVPVLTSNTCLHAYWGGSNA
ncbi:MAG: DUF2341 domain-containing protein, partial [Verrucomicrobiota bacterium]